jgi:hypothetical protein
VTHQVLCYCVLIIATGELLRGYWHHGKPTAPFQALETGTGYAFHAVRVAFAHNRPEVSLLASILTDTYTYIITQQSL